MLFSLYIFTKFLVWLTYGNQSIDFPFEALHLGFQVVITPYGTPKECRERCKVFNKSIFEMNLGDSAVKIFEKRFYGSHLYSNLHRKQHVFFMGLITVP